MRLQRDSYAPKSCAFDAANVQFLRAHLCKSHPVLQQGQTRADWFHAMSAMFSFYGGSTEEL